MQNLEEILSFARNKLKNCHIDSYNIDVMAIACHSFSISKEQILFNPKRQLSQAQINQFLTNINRRSLREPVSHIIGFREFYEDQFLINHHVLDPRPDSETIINTALKIIPDYNKNLKILELGIGSGCLILSILKKYPNALSIGVDISKEAINIAKQNSHKLKLEKRINFIQSNWFSQITPQKFDLIISNPPYIKKSDINHLQEEVRIFEPKLALDGGEDGLECYRKIAENITEFLTSKGYLILEIGYQQENDIIDIFQNMRLISKNNDLSNITRCLVFQNADS